MADMSATAMAPDTFDSLSSRIRLWFSYQRFGLLVLLISIAPPAAAYWALPESWWLWGGLAIAGLYGIGMAIKILAKFRHKLRVTVVYVRRYRRNGFSPALLERYADDPCYRVVCDEIMRDVGVPADERRQILKELKEEAGRPMLFVADPETGALVEKRGS